MSKFLVLMIAFFSVSANANYFKGGLGYTLSGEGKATGGGNNLTEKLDSEFLFPIIAAYGIEVYDQFYVEIEGSFRKNEYKDIPAGFTSAEPKILALAVNGAGSLPLTDAISLAGGVGLTFGSYSELFINADSGTALGVQVFGGADFKLQENITLGGEIRHFTTMTKVDLGQGADGSYKNTALLFVAKFAM